LPIREFHALWEWSEANFGDDALCHEGRDAPDRTALQRKLSHKKTACVQALTRVFWLCDGNQDGVLDDVELNKFQDTTGTPRGAEKVCGAWASLCGGRTAYKLAVRRRRAPLFDFGGGRFRFRLGPIFSSGGGGVTRFAVIPDP